MPPSEPIEPLVEVPDFFDDLLAFDVLFDLNDDSSIFDTFLRSVGGEAVRPEILEAIGEVVDESDVRATAIPHPVPVLSEMFDRCGSGILMSCLGTRFGRLAPLVKLRAFVVGTVSARFLDAARKGRDRTFRRSVPCLDRPSSSESESQAEISSGRS